MSDLGFMGKIIGWFFFLRNMTLFFQVYNLNGSSNLPYTTYDIVKLIFHL